MDKTVGFLITPTDSTISKPNAVVKKGYITRKFTATKKSRDIFMFLHEGTAYDLASGSTNIPFVAGNTMSDTNFETTDILQENTDYKIRVYDGDKISEENFTTKSFADGDASATGAIAYMGGLIENFNFSSNNPTDQEFEAAKATVPLTIERKTEEIMLVPYADDTYEGTSVDYFRNNLPEGGCSTSCGTGISGAHMYGLRREANKLTSIVYIISPLKRITSSYWTAKEGTRDVFTYNIEIISE